VLSALGFWWETVRHSELTDSIQQIPIEYQDKFNLVFTHYDLDKIRKLPSAQKLLQEISRPGTVIVQDPDATVVLRAQSTSQLTKQE